MRRFFGLLKQKKGSAIMTVIIVVVALALIGLAVTTLTVSVLQSNVADSSNNEAYYASESGVNSAVEQLKYEVISYYRDMADASGTEYGSLYFNFFQNIALNAQAHFAEPEIDGVQTSTTFYASNFDSQEQVCEYTISCVSTTADNASYQVNAKLLVKKIDISATTGGEFVLIDGAALIAGDLFEIPKKSGATINGGDVIVKEYIYNSSWNPCSINGGAMYFNPNIGDSVVDILNYTSYSDPDMSNPNAVANGNTSYNWGSIPPSPVKIISTPGSDIHVNSCTITGGVIHSRGDLHMNNGTFTVDLFADGDVHINNCTINGDIYCRGDFLGNNAVINGCVVAEGEVDWHNGAMNGSVYGGVCVDIKDASGIADIISPGPVDVRRAGVNGGLVFSSTHIDVGDCNISAVLYSMGDIVIDKSMSMNGAMIAKHNIYHDKQNTWFTINYSAEIIEGIMEDTDLSFFQPESGETQTLDSGVFVSEDIEIIGKVN